MICTHHQRRYCPCLQNPALQVMGLLDIEAGLASGDFLEVVEGEALARGDVGAALVDEVLDDAFGGGDGFGW